MSYNHNEMIDIANDIFINNLHIMFNEENVINLINSIRTPYENLTYSQFKELNFKKINDSNKIKEKNELYNIGIDFFILLFENIRYNMKNNIKGGNKIKVVKNYIRNKLKKLKKNFL
jgi:hypothetical protein